MIGWVLGAIATGCVCNIIKDKKAEKKEKEDYYRDLEYENYNLRNENEYLKLTFHNHMRLLANYDVVNKYSKKIGFAGAVDFFYYLAEYHDERFEYLARFLNKVRHVRNDVAHNGTTYNIDNEFLDKLKLCVRVCDVYDSMPSGETLYLS